MDYRTRKAQYMDATETFPDELVGATQCDCEEALRRMPGFCTQPEVERCSECSLCNYGRDCHNERVAE
jgi:hypothetical protein